MRSKISIFLFLLFHLTATCLYAESSAKISIKGVGLWDGLDLKESLKILDNSNTVPTSYDSDYIEDASWVLSSSLKSEGYINPTFELEIVTTSDEHLHLKWDGSFTPELHPSVRAKKLIFDVTPGIIQYYESVTIKGLPKEDTKKFQEYFYPSDKLISTKKSKYFTPNRFKKSIRSVLRVLHEEGYQEAEKNKPLY